MDIEEDIKLGIISLVFLPSKKYLCEVAMVDLLTFVLVNGNDYIFPSSWQELNRKDKFGYKLQSP